MISSLLKVLAAVSFLTFLCPAKGDSAASWIWQKDDGPANSWVAFRKTVEVPVVPSKAVATIAADTKFWLWINGELVVGEGGSAGAPSPAAPWRRVPEIWTTDAATKPRNTWSEEVNIQPYLKPGRNTIAILVWYWGRETLKGTHIDSGRGGMLFQAEIGGGKVVSDASWKAKLHPAYDPESGDTGKMVVAYNVKYDARQDMGDWSAKAWTGGDFSDAGWPAAVAKGQPPAAPWHNLVKSYVPRLIDHGLQDYENYPASRFPFVSDGKTIEAKLPFNRQITPYFEIESEAGKSIEISTDDRLNVIKAYYTTKAGPQRFEAYSWMNGHSVRYAIPAGVKVLGLKYRWMSVGELAGSFECSDPFLQRLWWMGRNTLFVCARDNFMDCPDRERALWIGDVSDQAGYLFYAMDESGRGLLKQAIRTTMAFSDNHVFGALGPLRIRELPSQSLQFIPQGIWQYYFNTGDRETLEYAYPFVRGYLGLWEMDAGGLPKYRSGGSQDSWDWVDWGEKDTEDKKVIQAALYYMALDSARDMAGVMGSAGDTAWYDSRLASMRDGFDKKYWTGKCYSSKPGKLQDDRANCLTILSGLADPSKYDSIVETVLIPNLYCSPHFEWMAEMAMCKAGRHDAALARMKVRYGKQVGMKNLTTLYETFPIGGSYNHAWNAPNTVLSREIAGIAATKPGWSEYQVLPHLGELTSLKEVVPSVKGTIVVDIRREGGTFRLDLKSPAGTRAMVGIPKPTGGISSVKVNGKEIGKAGGNGVDPAGETPDFLQFSVGPGAWSFEAAE